MGSAEAMPRPNLQQESYELGVFPSVTIGSPACACELYLTVLGLCVFCVYCDCGNTDSAHFPGLENLEKKSRTFNDFQGPTKAL